MHQYITYRKGEPLPSQPRFSPHAASQAAPFLHRVCPNDDSSLQLPRDEKEYRCMINADFFSESDCSQVMEGPEILGHGHHQFEDLDSQIEQVQNPYQQPPSLQKPSQEQRPEAAPSGGASRKRIIKKRIIIKKRVRPANPKDGRKIKKIKEIIYYKKGPPKQGRPTFHARKPSQNILNIVNIYQQQAPVAPDMAFHQGHLGPASVRPRNEGLLSEQQSQQKRRNQKEMKGQRQYWFGQNQKFEQKRRQTAQQLTAQFPSASNFQTFVHPPAQLQEPWELPLTVENAPFNPGPRYSLNPGPFCQQYPSSQFGHPDASPYRSPRQFMQRIQHHPSVHAPRPPQLQQPPQLTAQTSYCMQQKEDFLNPVPSEAFSSFSPQIENQYGGNPVSSSLPASLPPPALYNYSAPFSPRGHPHEWCPQGMLNEPGIAGFDDGLDEGGRAVWGSAEMGEASQVSEENLEINSRCDQELQNQNKMQDEISNSRAAHLGPHRPLDPTSRDLASEILTFKHPKGQPKSKRSATNQMPNEGSAALKGSRRGAPRPDGEALEASSLRENTQSTTSQRNSVSREKSEPATRRPTRPTRVTRERKDDFYEYFPSRRGDQGTRGKVRGQASKNQSSAASEVGKGSQLGRKQVFEIPQLNHIQLLLPGSSVEIGELKKRFAREYQELILKQKRAQLSPLDPEEFLAPLKEQPLMEETHPENSNQPLPFPLQSVDRLKTEELASNRGSSNLRCSMRNPEEEALPRHDQSAASHSEIVLNEIPVSRDPSEKRRDEVMEPTPETKTDGTPQELQQLYSVKENVAQQEDPAEDNFSPVDLHLLRVQWRIKRIGNLSLEQRFHKIQRYSMRKDHRLFQHKVSYDCRKQVADKRLRIKGRFIRKEDQRELVKQILKASLPTKKEVPGVLDEDIDKLIQSDPEKYNQSLKMIIAKPAAKARSPKQPPANLQSKKGSKSLK